MILKAMVKKKCLNPKLHIQGLLRTLCLATLRVESPLGGWLYA